MTPRSPGAGDEDDGAAPLQHYFTARPTAPHATRTLRFLYQGRVVTFTTDRGVFSYEQVDPGTALLIENLVLQGDESFLDMGCGWGAIGIAAALALPKGRATLVDVNNRAFRLARENARANRAANVSVLQGDLFAPVGAERFDVIASNPAYKAGREHVLSFLAQVPAHLTERGRLLLVGKGSQGVLFYQHWLAERWTSVEVLGRSSGYRVLEARGPRPAPTPPSS